MAADALVAAGWDVTVLEARERVGGRVWSDRATNGAIIERGAEWVEDDHAVLRGQCERFALPLVRAGMSYHDRRPLGGPPISDAALVAGRGAVRDLLAELGEEAAALSVAEAIQRLPVAEGVKVAFRARVECTSGTPAAELAATHLQMLAHAPDDADSLRFGEGSDSLARALAAQLGTRVRLGEPVVELAIAPDGVTVATALGSHAAEHVILALPKPLLEAAPFADVLPTEVAAVVAQLGTAHAAKLFVPLTGPAEPGAFLDTRRDYWAWTANEGDAGLRPILAGFAGSMPMIELLAVDGGDGSTWAGCVGDLLPELPLDLAAAGVQTWHDDPYARGVYTCVHPGSHPDDAVLRQQHGRLTLAGEFTDDVFSGYMEGALRSGVRAAHLVDPTLPLPPPATH